MTGNRHASFPWWGSWMSENKVSSGTFSKCTHKASVSWIAICICNQSLLSCDIKMSQQDPCQSEDARSVFTINIFYGHSHTEQETQPIWVQSDFSLLKMDFFFRQNILITISSPPSPLRSSSPFHISKSVPFLYCSHQNRNRHPTIMMMLIR